MYTDPIADYLTRIRNAIRVKKRVVEIPASNVKIGITKVLLDMGYISNYKVQNQKPQDVIKIALKYDPVAKVPAIHKLERISSPGLRRYANSQSIPRVMNGLGIAVLSTSKGIMTGKQARNENVGGEVLCFIS